MHGGMKTNTATDSMSRSLPVFAQIVHLIPPGLIEAIAKTAHIKAQVFSYSQQVYSLLLGQLAGAWSLNEICDAFWVHKKKLCRVRQMLPPCLNTFSHANRTRNPAIAQTLFWKIRAKLEATNPTFMHPRAKGKLFRFRQRRIFAIDSSVLQLTLKAFDWAQHRRRKAAAKLHMRCDAVSRLPAFAVVTSAKIADCRMMLLLCGALHSGDVAIFDKAYVDFGSLSELNQRNVFYVVREKHRMRYTVVRPARKTQTSKRVRKDEIIRLCGTETKGKYTENLKRIQILVELDGELREMVFLTNNQEWSPETIAELYRARWQVELLFKELKQTLQLRDFYGENENAVQWQIWTALLAHMLLRYLAWLSLWKGSYTRFVSIAKAAVWERTDLMKLFQFYGTAPPAKEGRRNTEAPYLPGFERIYRKSMGQQP